MKRGIISFCLMTLSGSATQRENRMPVNSKSLENQIPFHYVGGHLISVPVKINGTTSARFILDTGIGLNLISKSLLEQLGGTVKGNHVGNRMSGQALDVPLSSVGSVSFGDANLSNVPVGVWDFKDFFPATGEFSEIEGFLSLDFFKDQPFSIDYKSGHIVLEDEKSLRARVDAGRVVSISLDRQDVALSAFFRLALPEGNSASVEVDTGSDTLILDEKYISMLRKSIDPSGVDTKQGKDETGHSYARHFAKIAGTISLSSEPHIRQQNPKVMFQKIIYDGLIGDSFLKQFIVTFDLPRSRMIFANPVRASQ